MLRYCSLALLALCVACDAASPPPVATPPLPPTLFKPSVTAKQLMDEVIEPAANVYWDAVGTISDAHGTVERAPKTNAEWNAVRNAATVVAESGNLLMIDPRARNRDEWMALSRALVDVGERARAVAESRDTKAVFDVGADMYQACVNCHAIYLVGSKAIPPP